MKCPECGARMTDVSTILTSDTSVRVLCQCHVCKNIEVREEVE
jgi:hypothetical protein